jgi:RNA polymerase sigma-70 factor (ECF subfamily)
MISMTDSPATRVSLLIRIRDPRDQDAWRQFVRVYGSVIYGFARKRGLQDADAADLMQDVLRSVAGAAGRLDYDPRRGTFRSWLFTVTRNKVYNFLDGRRHQSRAVGGTTAMEAVEGQSAPPDGSEEVWDREYEQRTFAWAVEQVRGEFLDSTWQAFWLTAVEGKPAKEVGQKLGLSPGAVYVAKSRVLARLREQVLALEND